MDAPVRERTHVDAIPQALAFQDHVGVPLPDPAHLRDGLGLVEPAVLAAPGVDVEEPGRQHEMRVRVAVALVVQHPVHDGAVARVGLPDVAAEQVDLGLPRERFRQRDRDLAGEPGVVRLPVLLGFHALDVVPETLRKTRPGHPFRDVHRQQPGPRDGGSSGPLSLPQTVGLVRADDDPALRRLGEDFLQRRLERRLAVGLHGPRGGVGGQHDLGMLQLVGLAPVVLRRLSGLALHLRCVAIGGAVDGIGARSPGDRRDLMVVGRHLPSAYRSTFGAQAPNVYTCLPRFAVICGNVCLPRFAVICGNVCRMYSAHVAGAAARRAPGPEIQGASVAGRR